jgi:pimeloyl-ACP methyl ester carboxylesterase
MRRALMATAGLAAVVALTSGCSAGSPTPPAATSAGAATTSAAPKPPCNDASLNGHTVTFTNSLGGKLMGYLLGDGRTGIVLANETQHDACTWLPYAKNLADRGYRVLAFDFNGEHGTTFVQGSTEDGDVVAAAGLVRERGADKVVLLGASRGGAAVLVAATKVQPAVAAVLSLSGPASFNGMDALAAVPKLRAPVLYLVADEDDPFYRDARSLANATPTKLTTLFVIKGGGHGEQFVLDEVTTSGQAMAAIDDFLAKHVPAA